MTAVVRGLVGGHLRIARREGLGLLEAVTQGGQGIPGGSEGVRTRRVGEGATGVRRLDGDPLTRGLLLLYGMTPVVGPSWSTTGLKKHNGLVNAVKIELGAERQIPDQKSADRRSRGTAGVNKVT